MPNPTLRESAFRANQITENTAPRTMTLQGTINKTFLLLFICVLGAAFSWTNFLAWRPYLWLIVIAALAVGLIVSFKPKAAPFLSPVYALSEGLLLGCISAAYNAQWNGIVFNAVAATLLVFLIMLFLYKTQLVRVTPGFIKVIYTSTLAIFFLYVGSWLLSLFGVSTAYLTSSSPLAIVLSVVICAVAAFNLMLDFYFIDTMTKHYDAPKYMEWYGAFGLLVTLVWLYIEILNLLGKFQRR